MRTLQQTGSMISLSLVARDTDGTLQRLYDILTILASQLLVWLEIQIAAEKQRVRTGLLEEKEIILKTLQIEIASRQLSMLIYLEQLPVLILDWCEAVYIESCGLWGEVGFLFTGKLQPAYRV